jgi:uroporphyrinogen decarboxylase
MTHKERFLTALRKETPDRVPMFEFEFNESSVIRIGSYFSNDLPVLKPLIDYTPEERRRLFHVLFALVDGIDLDAVNYVFTTDAKRLATNTEHFKDDLGVVYRMSEHGDPFPVDGPVKTNRDLNRLGFPDPRDALTAFRYWRQHLPNRALVFCMPGPFKLSWSLMGGMQHLLLAYSMNETLSLALARATTDFVKAGIQGAIDEGADAILLDGDISFQNNTLMSPDHYRLYLKPFHHECVTLAHQHGLPIIKHSDGNFWKVMDDLLEIGFDGLHPIQPQCMDIIEVKTHVQGRACIIGNIDCSHLLPYGTEEQVVTQVKETIRSVAPGGGYVIASSNSIHPGCKPENVVAMFRAARQYGEYPININ